MSLPEPWSQLKKEILTEVKPSESEHEEIAAFIAKLKTGLGKALSDAGVDADVEVHGSVARDTWLVGQRDIDTFIIIRHGSARRELLRVNEVVKGYLGEGWVEAYAEHPYVKKEIEGFEIEFIPCFRAKMGKRFASSTDRTPLHTAYLLPRLNDPLRDDIRILKAFMMGVGVYGAEIKVGGFSGYLCELLIVYFGSFERVIEEVGSWGDTPVIQIEKAINPERFKEPFVVVDPVDPNRNVASAVTETTLWTLVAASRAFLVRPSKRFFKPEPRRALTGLLSRLEGRGVDVLFVVIPDSDPPVPDTLWGQLYRTEKAFGRALAEKGFKVFRSGTWSDEAKRHIFAYELESITLPSIVKKVGPPVRLVKDSNDFLSIYMSLPDLVSGPGIEGGKWWVEVMRKHMFTRDDLKRALSSGCEEHGVPNRVANLLRSGGKVLINEEIESEYNGAFPDFLLGFLKGRPDWLG